MNRDVEPHWLTIKATTQTGQVYNTVFVIAPEEEWFESMLHNAVMYVAFFIVGPAAAQHAIWQWNLEPCQNYQFN